MDFGDTCDSAPPGLTHSEAVRLASVQYTDAAMPVARRYSAPGQLQFITSSVYRRLKLLDSHRLRLMFVEVLREYRQEKGFLLIGWVSMPEHFHFLIKVEPAESTSGHLQELKKRTAQRIVSLPNENQGHAWRRKMLSGLRLPATVHSDSRYRVWQRRFYPYGVYSEKKRLEKLNYMHSNPVKRGLVRSPEE
jgi:REP element-mobilizing transposase RayT